MASSLSVSEVYNDNLFFTETNRKGDFSTAIMPGLTLTYDSRNFVLSGRYRGIANFQMRYPEANRYAQTASFDLDLPILSRQIKGMDVEINEEVTYTPSLPAFAFGRETQGTDSEVDIDRILRTSGGIRVRRTDTFRNRAGVSFGYTWSSRLDTTLSYSNTITRFKGTGFRDSDVHAVNLNGGYQWSPRTRLTASHGSSVIKYQRADSFLVQRFTIGAGHEIDPSLSISGGVGVAKLRNRRQRFTYSAGMSKKFKTSSISIRYAGGIGTGGGLARSLTFRQRLIGQASRALGQNTTGYVRLGYARSRSISGEELKIDTYRAGTGLSVRLLTWLSGGLSYTYIKQSRGGAGREGKRNLVMLTLTASGPTWTILQ